MDPVLKKRVNTYHYRFGENEMCLIILLTHT